MGASADRMRPFASNRGMFIQTRSMEPAGTGPRHEKSRRHYAYPWKTRPQATAGFDTHAAFNFGHFILHKVRIIHRPDRKNNRKNNRKKLHFKNLYLNLQYAIMFRHCEKCSNVNRKAPVQQPKLLNHETFLPKHFRRQAPSEQAAGRNAGRTRPDIVGPAAACRGGSIGNYRRHDGRHHPNRREGGGKSAMPYPASLKMRTAMQ